MKENKTQGEKHSYRTGSTKPPKDYGGYVAAVLVALIFIGGIVSAFGMLNIRLTEEQGEEKSPVSFASGDKDLSDLPLAGEEVVDWPAIGLSGEFFSEDYRRYYDLPAGAHITEVSKGGLAEKAGVLAGDILAGVNGVPVEDSQAWSQSVAETQAGGFLTLDVYRNGKKLSILVALE